MRKEPDAREPLSTPDRGPRPGDSAPATAAAVRPMRGSWIPGLAVALVLAVVAMAVGERLPVLGGPVTAVVLGVLVAAVRRPAPRLTPGMRLAGKPVLQTGVALLGAQLSLTQVLHVGAGSLPVMIGSLAACLLAARVIGRRLGVGGDLRTLIGAGTGICGASAIAAVTPVIGAASAQVAYAISTIFLFNIAAVVVFPLVGHLIGMDPQVFGLFAGTAVNDMSSVVAVATAYGPGAVDDAVVVKLTRTLMIIPVCLGLALLAGRRARSAPSAPVRPAGLVPWFLVAFLLAAAANSAGLVPATAHPGLKELSVFLITVALSAVGLSTDLTALRRTGPRPLLLGACLWVVVSSSSLALQYAFGGGLS
ncbi:YeiH family protein [Streptomyces sp. SLBN-115]|uniref:YeiH family protein n=1 Tax=Streptomyces sp. SLBN-115 TaxID=2768453 RepID=UPI001167FB6D|nr:putative sulfate exporter family transporter [Streptomyces sp. SLBN-115]TQJ46307.1 putative integral membrane protein (TIGR00698 family) [Streptomyces sp. SLBN-115]